MSLVRLIEKLFSKNVKPSSLIDAEFAYEDKIMYQSFCKLMKYEYKAVQLNNMYRRRAVHELSKKERDMLNDVGYFTKFDKIEEDYITKNQSAITQLVSSGRDEDFPFKLIDVLKDGHYVSPLSCITESLNHLVRDYNESYYEKEVQPLVNYILKEVSSIPSSDKFEVIIPGSGAGRIAYEISKQLETSQVYSIELNGLMYALNTALYRCEKNISISPFLLDYSNHLEVSEQTRSFEINSRSFEKPENLEIMCKNFLKFTPTTANKDKVGVVVTAFFMDTAENILEYMEKIESLKKYYKTIHWINIGPLKYGTRPKVVLTADEWTKLRHNRGWKDTSMNVDTSEEIGYLTNYKGLYKGRYSVLKFHSIYN